MTLYSLVRYERSIAVCFSRAQGSLTFDLARLLHWVHIAYASPGVVVYVFGGDRSKLVVNKSIAMFREFMDDLIVFRLHQEKLWAGCRVQAKFTRETEAQYSLP